MTLDAHPVAPLPSLADGRRWPLYVALAFAVVDFSVLGAAGTVRPLRRGLHNLAGLYYFGGEVLHVVVPACCLLIVLVVGITARRSRWTSCVGAGTAVLPAAFLLSRAIPLIWPETEQFRFGVYGALVFLLLFAVIGLVGAAFAYLLSRPVIAAARDAVWHRNADAGDTFLVRLGAWRTPVVLVAFALVARRPTVVFALPSIALGVVAGFAGLIRRARRRARLGRILRDEDDGFVARPCRSTDWPLDWWVRGPSDSVFEIVPRSRTDATYRSVPAQSPVAYASCVSREGVWHPVPVPEILASPKDTRGR
jgi:hypothetical protein